MKHINMKHRKMKRVFIRLILIVSLLMVASAPLAVYGDAIALPENKFFEDHQSEMVFLGRNFVANGDGGSVSVKTKPGKMPGLNEIQNGETVFIEFTCLYNGDFWGFVNRFSGWVMMDQMLVVYDFIAFEEEHISEFYPYEGNYETLKESRAAIVWPWPGAGTPLWTVEDLDMEYFFVTHAWTDPDGREWGFVSYLYGSSAWICLSDPLNSDIPAFNKGHEPAPWVPDTEHIPIGQSANNTIIVIIILVAGLAAGTMILIKVFWKPKKPAENKEAEA